MDRRDWAAAEAASHRAVALASEDALGWLLLPRAREKQGKHAQARAAYRKLVYSDAHGWSSSINTDPTTLMRYVLALSRTGAKGFKEAAAVYERARRQPTFASSRDGTDELDFDPSRADWPTLKAAAHPVLGMRGPRHGPPDPAEQREHLEAAVRLRPGSALAQLAYGRALRKAGRIADARTAHRRAAAHADAALAPKVQAALRKLDRVRPPR